MMKYERVTHSGEDESGDDLAIGVAVPGGFVIATIAPDVSKDAATRALRMIAAAVDEQGLPNGFVRITIETLH